MATKKETPVVIEGTYLDPQFLMNTLLVLTDENGDFLKNDKGEYLPDESKFKADETSAKLIVEREGNIGVGLEELRKLFPDFPKNLYLLAKWWEIKPARNEVVRMIEEEAAAAGYEHKYLFMIEQWGPMIESLKRIKNAVERLSYATNYFKPRVEIVSKKVKMFNVDGVIIKVPEIVVKELQMKYPDRAIDPKQKKAYKKEIIAAKVAEENVIDEL